MVNHVAVVKPPSADLMPDRALWALAWEHDLKRLEIGYEAQGYYNFRLQLANLVSSGRKAGWMDWTACQVRDSVK